jgi:hypothetical protein
MCAAPLGAYLGQKSDYLVARDEPPAFDPAPWTDLLRFRPPRDLLARLPGTWVVQDIALAQGPLNLDYYAVRVDRLPMPGGREFAAAQLLMHLRRNLNDFVQTGWARFEPYDERHAATWASSAPLGAVLHIDMSGPDNGSVLVSRADPASWTFTTLWTDKDGFHPVSGNREFGYRAGAAGTTIFYTRGADRTTGPVETAGADVGFFMADRLWKSLQSKLAAFVDAHAGHASTVDPVQRVLQWSAVSHLVP